MKLFNVQLVVRISLVGELEPLPDPEPSISENLPDDPIKASAVLLERYADKTLRAPPLIPYVGQDGPEGVTMNLNAKIAAAGFDDLQAILAKFNAALTSLTPDAELDRLGKKESSHD